MKNYLKLGILFLGFLFTLSSCMHEELETQEEQAEQTELNVKRISVEDFNSKNKFLKSHKILSSKFDINKSQNKNITANDGSFVILTDEILEVTKDSITTYTFRIEKPTDSLSSYENLMIEQRKDTLNFFIYKFKYNEDYPEFFPYETTIQKINENQINTESFDEYLKADEDRINSYLVNNCLYTYYPLTWYQYSPAQQEYYGEEGFWRPPHTDLIFCYTPQDYEITGEGGGGGTGAHSNAGSTHQNTGNTDANASNDYFPYQLPYTGTGTPSNFVTLQPTNVSYFNSFLRKNSFAADSAERHWLESHLSLDTKDMLIFLHLNEDSIQANNFVVTALHELMNGNASTFKSYIETIVEIPLSTMATVEDYKFRLVLVKYLIRLFGDEVVGLVELIKDIKNTTNVAVEDLSFVNDRLMTIYHIIKPHAFNIALSGNSLDSILTPTDYKALELNMTSIAIFPFFNGLGEHIPQTAEEWASIAKIMGQFLLEMGLAIIPGSDIIGIISGFNSGDVAAITIGIAGLFVDAFGGVLLKAIGKIGKVMYKTFKIFRILGDYLGIITRLIARGFKTKLLGGVVRIIDNVGTAIAEIQGKVMRFITNAAIDVIKVGELRLLRRVEPTAFGFINRTKIEENAMRILAENPRYANDIASVALNGDPGGNITERIVQNLLRQDGYIPLENIHLPGNRGFDNIFVKRNSNGEIIDVIINESKQITDGAISLSSGIVGCGSCTQMSDAWIQHTIDRMSSLSTNGNNEILQGLAQEINIFKNTPNNTITKIVSGVDKNSRELVIVNITEF